MGDKGWPTDAHGWPLTTEEILRERCAKLEAALRGVLVCREWEHRGQSIEELLPAELAAADEALRAEAPAA